MRRKRIAALMAGLEKEYQRDFARGLAEAAAEKNIDLCVFHCKGFSDLGAVQNEAGEGAIFDLPDLHQFDGVTALCATIPGKNTLAHVKQLLADLGDKPLVVIDSDEANAIKLTFDSTESECSLMEHMLQTHKYRRFALVTGPQHHKVAQDRAQLSIDMIRAYGGELPKDHIFHGDWTRDSGYRAADALLALGGELPEAIIAGNDDMAFGMIDRMEQAGIQVPGQVWITGYDAKKEAVARGLLTLRRPSEHAGKVAVELLYDWMNGNPRMGQYVSLPTEVVYGDSCGCPRCATDRTREFVRSLGTERLRIERSLVRASVFSNELGGVSDAGEIGAIISEHAKRWDIQDLHVCVNPLLLQAGAALTNSRYPDEMLLLSGYSHGRVFEQTKFPRSQLIPVLNEERDKPCTLVFSPLYYQERIFGYAVLDLTFASSLSMFPVITMLDGALMNLQMQNTVRAYAQTVEHMSEHDPLTGLLNRRGYQQESVRIFEEARQAGKCAAYVSIDMDGMKQTNDRMGHQAGDQAICRMAEALRELEKLNMTCIHISGDEFVAIGVTDSPESEQIIRIMLEAGIGAVNARYADGIAISASVGIHVAVPGPDEICDEFLKQADRKMYEKKREHHAQHKM